MKAALYRVFARVTGLVLLEPTGATESRLTPSTSGAAAVKVTFFLLLAVPVFSAEPPKLPPSPLLKSYPLRLVPERSTLVSVVPTNRIRCTTNCPIAPKGVRLDWDYAGTDPAFTSFRFYGRKDAASARTLLGTNKSPSWTLWFSNAPSMLVECVAVDKDMVKSSDGRPK